ncbi:MAG: hypothetical protein HY395_02310 [Candidatus Doudnabacteria bacterium]|nr:hypothetical protein [Candidatus Doudnabacteria bacterium]
MWGDDYEFGGREHRNPRERFARSQAERKEYEEHLLRAVEVRQPSGPLWEEIKKRNPDIPERDLILAASAGLDYIWSGVVRLKDEEADSDINLPITDEHADRIIDHTEDAPFAQNVGRIKGRNYVFITSHTKVQEVEDMGYRSRAVSASDEYQEIGIVPGDKSALSILKLKRRSRDFRKLQGYKSLFSFPNAPGTARPPIEFYRQMETEPISERLREKTVRNHERNLAMRTLAGAAWKMRYELFIWSGIHITDEQFSARMREVDQAFKDDVAARKLGPHIQDWWYALQDSDQSAEKAQMGVLLQLAREAQGVKKSVNLMRLVEVKSEETKALIDEFKDYPGFRVWAGETLGYSKRAGHSDRIQTRTYEPYDEIIDRDAEKRRTPEFTAAIQQFSSTDQEYLKNPEPKYEPTEFDAVIEKLEGNVEASLSPDKVAILRMMTHRERMPEYDSVRYEAFVISILNDHPELKDTETVQNNPSVLSRDPRAIATALLLGSRYIVSIGYAEPGVKYEHVPESEYDKWKLEVEKIAKILNRPIEQLAANKKVGDSLAIDIDFGQGPETVMFDYIGLPFPNYGDPRAIYDTPKVRDIRPGLITDFNFEEGDFLRNKMPKGSLVVTASKTQGYYGETPEKVLRGYKLFDLPSYSKDAEFTVARKE